MTSTEAAEYVTPHHDRLGGCVIRIRGACHRETGTSGSLMRSSSDSSYSSRWGQNNAADGNARAEGAAAVQMARDAVKFEAPDRDRIRQSLLRYEQAAIAEWSQAEPRRSTAADAALARLDNV
jgi:hypothetical protein